MEIEMLKLFRELKKTNCVNYNTRSKTYYIEAFDGWQENEIIKKHLILNNFMLKVTDIHQSYLPHLEYGDINDIIEKYEGGADAYIFMAEDNTILNEIGFFENLSNYKKFIDFKNNNKINLNNLNKWIIEKINNFDDELECDDVNMDELYEEMKILVYKLNCGTGFYDLNGDFCCEIFDKNNNNYLMIKSNRNIYQFLLEPNFKYYNYHNKRRKKFDKLLKYFY